MSHVLPKSMQNYCTFSWSSPTVCPDGSGHVLLPWLEYKCEGKLLHVAVSTQPVFGISLECSLTSYLWLATHWTPLYSTRQTNQRSVSLTDIRWQQVYSNCYGKIVTLIKLWWPSCDGFKSPHFTKQAEIQREKVLCPGSSSLLVAEPGLDFNISHPMLFLLPAASPLYCKLTFEACAHGSTQSSHTSSKDWISDILILRSRSCVPSFLPTVLK